MQVAADVQEFADMLNAETVSVYQAVQLTGLCHMTIRRRIAQRRIRAVRIAGNWRIWLADLNGLR